MNRYDIVSRATGKVTHSYTGERPRETPSRAWEAHGPYDVVVTNIDAELVAAAAADQAKADARARCQKLDWSGVNSINELKAVLKDIWEVIR